MTEKDTLKRAAKVRYELYSFLKLLLVTHSEMVVKTAFMAVICEFLAQFPELRSPILEIAKNYEQP